MKPIEKTAVLGAGTMGPGLAQSLAMGGLTVTMWTRSAATRSRAEAALAAQLQTFEDEGELREPADSILARIRFADSLAEAVTDADFIMETITEDPAAKSALYAELAGEIRPDTILASNTSALDIFSLVPEQLLPQLLICHWYAPAQLIPLVEVVKSEQAPQELADSVMALLRRCGKTAVQMKKFIRGYIVNRLQQCLDQEIFHLLDGGYCDAADIDLAAKACLMPRACVTGLCQEQDFAGLDVTAAGFRSYSIPARPAGESVPRTLQDMLDRGALGLKSGRGFYDYTDTDPLALQAKRDRQLFEIFRLENRLLDDPV